MPHRQFAVSEARASLSHLLKQLQAEPDTVYEITVNGLILGELRAPSSAAHRVKPGHALQQALEAMGTPEVAVPQEGSVAEAHDRSLYTTSAHD